MFQQFHDASCFPTLERMLRQIHFGCVETLARQQLIVSRAAQRFFLLSERRILFAQSTSELVQGGGFGNQGLLDVTVASKQNQGR